MSYPQASGSPQKIAQTQPFGDIEIGDGAIKEMFEAATTSQVPVLEKIFGKQVEKIDFNKIKSINDQFDDMPIISFDGGNEKSLITLGSGSDGKNHLYLHPSYNFKLDK